MIDAATARRRSKAAKYYLPNLFLASFEPASIVSIAIDLKHRAVKEAASRYLGKIAPFRDTKVVAVVLGFASHGAAEGGLGLVAVRSHAPVRGAAIDGGSAASNAVVPATTWGGHFVLGSRTKERDIRAYNRVRSSASIRP